MLFYQLLVLKCVVAHWAAMNNRGRMIDATHRYSYQLRAQFSTQTRQHSMLCSVYALAPPKSELTLNYRNKNTVTNTVLLLKFISAPYNYHQFELSNFQQFNSTISQLVKMTDESDVQSTKLLSVPLITAHSSFVDSSSDDALLVIDERTSASTVHHRKLSHERTISSSVNHSPDSPHAQLLTSLSSSALSTSASSPASSSHPSYGTIVGYCFTLNYILGVGVLGMPKAFSDAGYILSTVMLAGVTGMAVLTSMWCADVGMRELKHRREKIANGQENTSSSTLVQMNELTVSILGKKASRLYELCVFIYLIGSLWSYSSVFSSSLTSHIPLKFITGSTDCSTDLDGTTCYHAYLFYIMLFAIVCVPLTCIELTEMKVMQVTLAIMRFLCLGVMMCTSIVGLYQAPFTDDNQDAPPGVNPPYYSDIQAVKWAGLAVIFPTAIYSQIFHHSIPGLIAPLKHKKSTPKLFTAVLASTFLLYSSLGITAGLYYGSASKSPCTLNWVDYNGVPGTTDRPGWATFISYLVVLFPPIDIISAYPLNAITLANNIKTALPSSVKNCIRSDRVLTLSTRLFAGLFPIAGSMLVRDLSTILSYTGCVGVMIAFIFPAVMQYVSIRQYQQRHGEKADIPSYNSGLVRRFINSSTVILSVFILSVAGLIAVIVLSIVDG